MSRKVRILLILICVLLVLIGVSYGIASRRVPSTPAPSSTVEFPLVTGAKNERTFETADANGNPLMSRDFIHNGETLAVPDEPGTYLLAGDLGYCLADGSCPSGAKSDSYHISYDQQNHLFTIVLLKEPLKEVRLQAEQFLIQRLGISQAEMCMLNYDLGTITSVNSYYAGQSLGFSFCPNAVLLP